MEALEGAEPAGARHTSPLIKSCFVLFPLYVTVTNFSKRPSEAALYPTLIFSVAPGAIGSLLHSGVVQPQLACTLSRRSGVVPLLVMRKVW